MPPEELRPVGRTWVGVRPAGAVVGVTVQDPLEGHLGVQLARGRSGSPYSQLGAVAGIAYLLAFFAGRWRS